MLQQRCNVGDEAQRRMKKALCLVGCALLVVCALAPYGFGIRTEQTLTTLVQLVADAWDIPMHTTRYTRGWFGSTAETFLALPPEVAALLRPYLPRLPSAAPEGLTMTHSYPAWAFPPRGPSRWRPVAVPRANHAYQLACPWSARSLQEALSLRQCCQLSRSTPPSFCTVRVRAMSLCRLLSIRPGNRRRPVSSGKGCMGT